MKHVRPLNTLDARISRLETLIDQYEKKLGEAWELQDMTMYRKYHAITDNLTMRILKLYRKKQEANETNRG